jgi:hypothetical protein
VSTENFAGDQLNEAGTAAETRAVLMEAANRLSFFMIVSRLMTTKVTDQYVPRFLALDQIKVGGPRPNLGGVLHF